VPALWEDIRLGVILGEIRLILYKVGESVFVAAIGIVVLLQHQHRSTCGRIVEEQRIVARGIDSISRADLLDSGGCLRRTRFDRQAFLLLVVRQREIDAAVIVRRYGETARFQQRRRR